MTDEHRPSMLDGATDAELLLGHLIGATTGWDDFSVGAFVTEISSWTDPVAAEAAVRHVARTWTRSTRPPLGVLVAEYARREER